MIRLKIKYSFILSAIILFYPAINYAQTDPNDYKGAINSREYTRALDIINVKLNDYYTRKVEDKRIPEQMVSILNVGEKTDLVQLFRKRKEKG